jgi:hypothetical protein
MQTALIYMPCLRGCDTTTSVSVPYHLFILKSWRQSLSKNYEIPSCKFKNRWVGIGHRVPTPPPLSPCVANAVKNHLNEEITPLLPTGIGGQYSYSQTISNLGHAALLRRCELPELPPINAELIRGAL